MEIYGKSQIRDRTLSWNKLRQKGLTKKEQGKEEWKESCLGACKRGQEGQQNKKESQGEWVSELCPEEQSSRVKVSAMFEWVTQGSTAESAVCQFLLLASIKNREHRREVGLAEARRFWDHNFYWQESGEEKVPHSKNRPEETKSIWNDIWNTKPPT